MGFTEIYDLYWNQYADSRIVGLPLMQSAITIPLLTFLYLYIVLKGGPEFMKNRKPYNLKTFIMWYNIFQIVINAYIVQQNISAGWFTEISMFCPTLDYTDSPNALKMARSLWIGTLVKLIDLIETIVFVLRKKYNQVSFLHVYHHATTVWIIWILSRYNPLADITFPLVVNCGIHVMMYSYYLLSSLGPTVQKIINPFKPFITIIQMVQFVCLILFSMQAFLPSCNMSKAVATVLIADLIVNFVLFYKFYQQSYVKYAHKKK